MVRRSGRCIGSEKPYAVRNWKIRRYEHDFAGFIGKSDSQDLGHEGADLARREVDHARDLPAHQAFRRIMFSDLCGGTFAADLRTEVDRQFERGLSRLREFLDVDDCTDADVDLEEIVERDLRAGARLLITGHLGALSGR